MAIDRAPREVAAHNNLAVVCMMTGRLDEARKEITAAEEAGFMVAQRFKNALALSEPPVH